MTGGHHTVRMRVGQHHLTLGRHRHLEARCTLDETFSAGTELVTTDHSPPRSSRTSTDWVLSDPLLMVTLKPSVAMVRGDVAPLLGRGGVLRLHPLGRQVERVAGIERDILARRAVTERRLADQLQPAVAVGVVDPRRATRERLVAERRLQRALQDVGHLDRHRLLVLLLRHEAIPRQLAAHDSRFSYAVVAGSNSAMLVVLPGWIVALPGRV